MRLLRRVSAISPDDAAQIIMLRMHLSGRGWEYPTSYLWTAAWREARDQRAEAKTVPLTERDVATLPEIVSERPALALPLTDAEKDWLLDYYDSKGHTGYAKVKAFRLRRKARTL